MTGPDDPGATWWAEIEESLGHLDVAEQYRAGHIAPFGPTGQETTALALHPAGRSPRGEVLRQLDRIEHDQARTMTALRWVVLALLVQIGVTVASTLIVLTR